MLKRAVGILRREGGACVRAGERGRGADLERIKKKCSLIGGRARPPGGPCPWMVCDGLPGGRPLPKTATQFLKML